MAKNGFIVGLLLIFLPFFFFSCKDRVPSKYPSKKEMASILVDIHLAESTLVHRMPRRIISDDPSKGIYRSVSQKYGLTKVQFDSALYWYTSHPQVYLKVYDEVIARLSEMEAQAVSDLSKQQEKDKLLAQKMSLKRLWNGNNAYRFPYPDSIDTQFPIDIQVDSLKLGDIRYKALYRFKKEELSKKAEAWLICCYADSTRDTIKTKIVQSTLGRTIVMESELKRGKVLIGIRGFMLKHEPNDSLKVDIEAIQLDHLPSQNKADYE